MRIPLDLNLEAWAGRGRRNVLPIQYPAMLRSLRVGMLLLAVIILNLIDLAYTLFAHRIGMLTEMNPIADGFLRVGLIQSLICYKLLMIICGSLLLWKSPTSRWAVPSCWILLAAYAVLCGVWYLWVKDIVFSYEVRLVTMSPIHNLIQH